MHRVIINMHPNTFFLRLRKSHSQKCMRQTEPWDIWARDGLSSLIWGKGCHHLQADWKETLLASWLSMLSRASHISSCSNKRLLLAGAKRKRRMKHAPVFFIIKWQGNGEQDGLLIWSSYRIEAFLKAHGHVLSHFCGATLGRGPRKRVVVFLHRGGPC